MQNSKIEWTDHTINLWWGCTSVHAGCDNCYAETLDNRYHHNNTHWGIGSKRLLVESVWHNLKKFQVMAQQANEKKWVFVGSMMDIFEKPQPVVDKHGNVLDGVNTESFRQMLFDAITENCFPNLIFQLLTKRPSNILKYIPSGWHVLPPKNVFYGTSVSEQKNDKLIIELLKVPGKHFISLEPMLTGVDLTRIVYDGFEFNALNGVWDAPSTHNLTKLDWVIVGGESGSYKRFFNCDWARKIKDDCNTYNVPFFMKQVDKIRPIPDDLQIKQFPDKNN
jgi:protein gp37